MPVRIPEERSEQARRLAATVLREPFRRRCWAELGFFLASGALAFGAAAVLAAMGFAGLVLTVVFVGVVILAGGLRVARGLGTWQRALAKGALGEDIAGPDPFNPRPGLFGWLRAGLTDGAAWRAVAYFVIKLPLTLFGVWFALSVWLEAIVGVASPLFGGGGFSGFGFLGRVSADHGPTTGFAARLGTFVLGVLFLFVAPWTMRLVVYVDRRLMHLLLGPDAATSR